MCSILLLSALVFCSQIAISLAAPVAQPQVANSDPFLTSWGPAASTKTTCDTESDRTINFATGHELKTVINDACAAMMPPCAYQERLSPDVICVQTIDWPLKGPQMSLQKAIVETQEGQKMDLQFTVTPVAQLHGTSLTKLDCYGYLVQILGKTGPQGCYHEGSLGVGKVTVGGASSLAGAVFEVSIVAKQ